MDETQAAKWRRAFTVYGVSLWVAGMATAMVSYILLPIEIIFVIAVGVALISAVIGVRAYRTIKALSKSVAKSAQDSAQMVQENEAVVRRAFDEIAQGELAAADEIIAPEFVRHDLGANFPDVTGPEGVKRLIAALRAGFPDIQTSLDDVISDGDRVVVRFTARATHKGHFQGIAPTGRRVEWAGVNIYRVADGKIRETWQLADMLGLMRQLGVVPAAEDD